MKILFLDIDGVLNRCGESGHGLEDDKMELVRDIVTASHCEIVLSSTWRKTEHQRERITAALRECDLEILDCTPVFDVKIGALWASSPRWKEIHHWLNRRADVEAFVILDDEPDMGELNPHLVKTDSYTGLTLDLAAEVIRRLNGGL